MSVATRRHCPIATLALVGLAALMACAAGCGNRDGRWALTALIETADSYIAPDGAPVVQFHVTVSGTPADTVDLEFEYSLDGGGTWADMPVAGASDGTVVFNRVFDVASPFVRHTIEWNTTGLAAIDPVDARVRIMLDDGSTRGANGDGTATVLSRTFSLDNSDGAEPDPSLDVPVVSAGVLSGSNGDFRLEVTAGDALDVVFGATDAGQNLTLRAEVTGGTITPAAAGFATAFPAQSSSPSPCSLQLAGTAAAPVGNVELRVTVTDSLGGAATLRLLVIFNNSPPVIGAPVNAAGVLGGADPDWTLTVATGDSLAVNIPCSDPDTPPTTLAASITGGNLTPAQAGFSTAFPKTVIGNTPVMQFAGTASGVVGTVVITVVATDNTGSQDRITLVVSINNTLPWFEPLPPTIVRQLGEGGFSVYGNDVDPGETLTISATAVGGSLTPAQAGYALPAQSNGPSQLRLPLTGTALQVGTLVIRLDLTDGHGYTASMTVTLFINGRPVWGAPQGPTPVNGADPDYTIYIAANEPLDWSISATDPNVGDTLTVEVHDLDGDAAGAGFDPIVDLDGPDGEAAVTFQFSGQWAASGTVEVELRVYDESGELDWVVIEFVLRRSPRVFDPSIAGLTGSAPAWTTLRNVGDTLAFMTSASADGPGALDTITFSVAVTDGTLSAAEAGFDPLPGPLNGRSAQHLSFTGSCAQPGWIELTFTVDDTVRGHAEATLTIVVNAPPLIAAPDAPGEISGSRPTFFATVGIGESLAATISASDPDGDDVDLSMTITGGSLNAVDAGFTAVPTSAPVGPAPSLVYNGTALNAGTIEFTFLADDGNGRTDTWTLRIRITTFRIRSFTSSTARPRYGEIVNLEWSIDGPTDTLRIDPPGYNVQGLSSRIATPFPTPLNGADPGTFYVLRATTPEYPTDTIAPAALRVLADASGYDRVDFFNMVRAADGGMVTLGTYHDHATLVPGNDDEVQLEPVSGYSDVNYLVIHRPDGGIRALRLMPGASAYHWLQHLVCAPDGRVIVVGAYNRAVLHLSWGQPDQIDLPGDGGADVFIASYAADGALQWARRVSGSGGQGTTGAAVMADGRIVVVLGSDSDMVLGAGGPGEIQQTGPTTGVAVFSPDGAPLRFVRLFDDSVNRGICVAASADGAIYLAGMYRDGDTIAPGQPGETVLATSATTASFVARLGAFAQLQWVRTGETPAFAEASTLVSLRDGGVAIAGTFGTSLTLGSGEPDETTLVDTVNHSFFVAAYDADGTLRWARTSDGTTRTDASSIDEQPDGSVVVAGTFKDTTTFGPGEPGETAVVASAYQDAFGAVYAADGTFVRVEAVVDTGNVDFVRVRQTGHGGFALAARGTGTVQVRAGQPEELTSTFVGGGPWLASFEPVNFRILELRPGSVNRASSLGGGFGDVPHGIAVAPDGSTCVAGQFEVNIRVDEDPDTIQVVGYDEEDILLARHAADGSFLWVAAAGGEGEDVATGVCALPTGDAVIVGYVRSADAVFGDGEFKETHITNAAEGEHAMFVARYDAIGGDLVWAVTTGGTAETSAGPVCALPDGRVVVGGVVHEGGAAIFGEGEPNETTINAGSFQCLFFACYRPDGTLDWARAAHSVGWGGAVEHLAAHGGRVVAFGTYNDNAVFGPFEPGQTPLQDNGEHQVYLAALDTDDGQLVWVRRTTSASGDCTVTGLAIAPDGRIACSGAAADDVTLALGHASQTGVPLAPYVDGWLAWFTPGGAVDQVTITPGRVRALTALPDSTIVVSGRLGVGPTVFGAGEPDEMTLTGTDAADAWIATWRPDGTFSGASQIADEAGSGQNVWGLAARPDGSIAVAGSYSGNPLLGYGEPGQLELVAPHGSSALFVARYHPFR